MWRDSHLYAEDLGHGSSPSELLVVEESNIQLVSSLDWETHRKCTYPVCVEPAGGKRQPKRMLRLTTNPAPVLCYTLAEYCHQTVAENQPRHRSS